MRAREEATYDGAENVTEVPYETQCAEASCLPGAEWEIELQAVPGWSRR